LEAAGTLGGIVAGSLFVIPSIFVLLLLSYLAVAHSDVPAINGLLYGVQPVVIAIVVEAVLRIGKRTLNHRLLIGFAILAFIALYFLSVPFPLVVLVAAIGGLLLSRVRYRTPSKEGGTAPPRQKGLRWTGLPPTSGLPCCAT
jgi:chromate transporter